MKMVKGIFIILLFYFIGECMSYLIKGFIPGSIIGMMLLFLSLYLKIINPESVDSTANAITKNMAIFFIPSGAGLMSSFGVLSKFWASIIITCSISTILVIAVVGIVQQQMEKGRSK
ncbi:CidA/LrgA family protein [Dysgonomonas sp. HDW5A]|nr:CidA/LrgA family protein [Dysgonomonas sp. HDW5B]QIK61345.1 CidA/LrgA family protein [Dysgonomonas sp. HDW5A]